VAFALILAEDKSSFEWDLRELDKARRANDIKRPQVIISDFDIAFKNVAETLFPTSYQ
jgi:hypothetical protein